MMSLTTAPVHVNGCDTREDEPSTIDSLKAKINQHHANKSKARLRWQLLSNTIRNHRNAAINLNSIELNDASIRKFSSFNLFNVYREGDDIIKNGGGNHSTPDMKCYKFQVQVNPKHSTNGHHPLITNGEGRNESRHSIEIDVVLLNTNISMEQLASEYDLTGSCCLWPAEEVLAFYCLQVSKHLYSANLNDSRIF